MWQLQESNPQLYMRLSLGVRAEIIFLNVVKSLIFLQKNLSSIEKDVRCPVSYRLFHLPKIREEFKLKFLTTCSKSPNLLSLAPFNYWCSFLFFIILTRKKTKKIKLLQVHVHDLLKAYCLRHHSVEFSTILKFLHTTANEAAFDCIIAISKFSNHVLLLLLPQFKNRKKKKL